VLDLLLALQLFTHPITGAYAAQVKKDVVISVTFADVRPSKVCTHLYATDDVDMLHDIDRPHCWTPKNSVASLDVWPNLRLDDGNFKVVVSYSNRPDETFALVMKVNT
jgi:hypothetical protein